MVEFNTTLQSSEERKRITLELLEAEDRAAAELEKDQPKPVEPPKRETYPEQQDRLDRAWEAEQKILNQEQRDLYLKDEPDEVGIKKRPILQVKLYELEQFMVADMEKDGLHINEWIRELIRNEYKRLKPSYVELQKMKALKIDKYEKLSPQKYCLTVLNGLIVEGQCVITYKREGFQRMFDMDTVKNYNRDGTYRKK